MNSELRIFPSSETLNRAAAEAFAQLANKAIAEKGRFTVALAGGNTPRAIYQLLRLTIASKSNGRGCIFGVTSAMYRATIRQQLRMAREALFDHVPIVAENVHRMPTEFTQSEIAAQNYEQTLRDFWPASFRASI
jgi:6-phosphogluconolactonase